MRILRCQKTNHLRVIASWQIPGYNVAMITKHELQQRLERGESQRAIARSLGVTYQSLAYHRRRWGMPLLRKARTKGSDHASWRGGSFIDRWGYKMILCPERGKASKYVMEHVLVAEQMIGRELKSNEIVHHINGLKGDNRPENLLVLTRIQHRALHAQLEAIAMSLFRNGQIIFTIKDGYSFSI